MNKSHRMSCLQFSTSIWKMFRSNDPKIILKIGIQNAVCGETLTLHIIMNRPTLRQNTQMAALCWGTDFLQQRYKNWPQGGSKPKRKPTGRSKKLYNNSFKLSQ